MIKKLKNRDEIQKDLDIMYVQKVKEIKKLKLDSKSEIAVIEIMFWAMVETGAIYIRYMPTFTIPCSKKVPPKQP